MFYSPEKTKELAVYHIGKIAKNWVSDDFIMGHFTSGRETLIDLRDHKIANFPYRSPGYCQATPEEICELIDINGEVPTIVSDAMNSVLAEKGITSPIIVRFTENRKIYVKLDIDANEAERRYKSWKKYYMKTRKNFW